MSVDDANEHAGVPRDATSPEIGARIEAIYRVESRRVLATLIRLLGDFDLAEEALQDAFTAAMTQWPRDGFPANPRSWLVSAGRFKQIDRMRRGARFDAAKAELGRKLAEEERLASLPGTLNDPFREVIEAGGIEDDRLRLIFICCHPALSADAQIALTLREVCGLTTEEIADACLASPTTIAQRIVRAKTRIRDAKIPYEIPGTSELGQRLDAVLRVIYLVFNEGYFSSFGESLTRVDLSSEAIRLGRLLVELLPDPEAIGLLALMLLHDSRRLARATRSGEIILLEDQDRSRWNRDQIAEGTTLVKTALSSQTVGTYAIQAAIAAVHAAASGAGDTDWTQIVGLYDVLQRLDASPIVELNRAVAIAMRDGPEAGIALIDTLLARGDLVDYHLAHGSRAELLRRLGRNAEARQSFERALALATQQPERELLTRRLAELGSDESSQTR